MNSLTDVWALETPDEEAAANDLCGIVNAALNKDKWAREYLQRLWDGESWKSIKAKLEVEGSTWYVWWMDGVREHMRSQDNQAKIQAQIDAHNGLEPTETCQICVKLREKIANLTP